MDVRPGDNELVDAAGVNQPAQNLSDSDVQLLTAARDAQFRLEALEFAYDSNVRRLTAYKTWLDFLAVLVAIVFLFLQYLATKENLPRAHDVLGYAGTGLSFVIILLAIWSAMARWSGQIEKKLELSTEIRTMLGNHRVLSEARPLEHAQLRSWVGDSDKFEQKRKHELASLSRYFLLRGFQHTGNKHPGCGITCSICGKLWVPESNKSAWKTWIPFCHCNGCGI
jgi:hypothetical protein